MSGTKILELGFKSLLGMLMMWMMTTEVKAQVNPNVALLEFKYGFKAPLADMKKRFGVSNDIGLSLQLASLSKTIFAGIEGIFFFGSTVKEDVLAHLRSFDGTIIGFDGHEGDINLKERGYYAGID
ncbi:MAG: hypothetical protein ABIQ02_13195, partial [Saprospiraceae bacterium]